MTRDEVQHASQAAADRYTAGDHQGAFDAYAALLVEPQAAEDLSGIHWYLALCQAWLGNGPLAIEHAGAAGYTREHLYQHAVDQHIPGAERLFAAHGAAIDDIERAETAFLGRDYQAAAIAFDVALGHPIPDDRRLDVLAKAAV